MRQSLVSAASFSQRSLLVDASRVKLDPFHKDYFVSSIGVDGYGNIGDYNLLAGALNFKGYRTKTGKYIKGSYLKNVKSKLTKKYGRDFVVDLVEWERVSTPVRPFPTYKNIKDIQGNAF